MRFVFFIVLFFSLSLTVKSQSWYPPGLPFSPGGYVYELAAIDSDLFVGGLFQLNIGDTPTYSIARWNGLKWDSLGTGVLTGCNQWGYKFPGTVNTIKKYNAEIYAGGQFDWAGGGCTVTPKLAKWDGTKWDSVNTVNSGPTSAVKSLEIFENKLYVGGQALAVQDTNGNSIPIISLGTWNGSIWEEIPAGKPDGTVSSLIFKGELYVGGMFNDVGGVSAYNIARWNGVQWKSCGLGSTGETGKMVVDTVNNKLYVLTDFYVVNSDSIGILTNGVSRWNGQLWEKIPPHYYSSKRAITIYHGKLYVGTVDTPRLSAFDGIAWQEVDTVNNTVLSLGVYNDTLFVGGGFDYVIDSNGDTINSPYLARYWTPNYCDSIPSIALSADTVYFSDSTVVQFAPTGFANQYRWEFDSINFATDTTTPQSFYFDSIGENNIKLVATYGLCPWDTVIKTVTVINNCEQTIITAPDTIPTDTIIQIMGSNAQATQWQWFLGNSTVADTNKFIYFFDTAGVYTITAITGYKNCHDTATATVVAVYPDGIKEVSGSSRLKIYPNPSEGSFTVEIQNSSFIIQNSSLKIYDAKGKLIKELEVRSQKTVVSKEKLTKGVYFVHLIEWFDNAHHKEGKIVAKEKIVIE